MQYGHLVGRDILSVGLILAGGAAHCGSVGWWWWLGEGGGGGGAGSGAGRTAAAAGGASATGSRCGDLLLFGLLTGELGDAEDKLDAAQFDVAAMVEQSRALPACPAASNQAGAARLTAAQQLGATLRLAAHHSTGRQQTHHRAGSLVILTLLTATCTENTGRHLETVQAETCERYCYNLERKEEITARLHAKSKQGTLVFFMSFEMIAWSGNTVVTSIQKCLIAPALMAVKLTNFDYHSFQNNDHD